jgi:ribonuclease HII
MQPSFLIEKQFNDKLIVGIDEVGRGSLAGPVVACCVLLNQKQNYHYFSQINDSKKINSTTRKKLASHLMLDMQFGLGIVDSLTIDRINILQATKMAMHLAYLDFCFKYNFQPDVLLVDGNIKPFSLDKQLILPIIKGDTKSLSIASASIIAKEIRDEILTKYHQQFSMYHFKTNYGYLTLQHKLAIKKFGLCPIHRHSFKIKL